ncbi:MAG: YesL family protein [Oscillospiraceae bacterium]|nr:YesL family protein [Oscillospiraceae bacterium]
MFRNIFNPDSPLMITMAQITDCIFLSLLWILCCFPLITVGASSAALYDSVFRAFRQGEKNSWGRFFKVFKENFKSGILPGLIFLLLFYLLVKLVVSVWNAATVGAASFAVFAAVALVAVLVLGLLSLIFPVLSRFENSLSGLVKNTVFLAMANLPRTLLLGILYALSILLCLRFVFPLFFLPALASLISTVLIEPMFRPFMPSED